MDNGAATVRAERDTTQNARQKPVIKAEKIVKMLRRPRHGHERRTKAARRAREEADTELGWADVRFSTIIRAERAVTQEREAEEAHVKAEKDRQDTQKAKAWT
ncbi:MAG: hypothetical protein Q9180_002401 [Flavoplaca navasiana]